MTATPLPEDLAQRFHHWHNTKFKEDQPLYQHLTEHGQSPHTMVISCCDSRLHATELFGAASGEFFIHRNIANLVPPFDPKGRDCNTSASLEYGIPALKVKHVMVLGHAQCGGINAGFHLHHSGQGHPIFIEQWLEQLQPAFANLDRNKDDAECIKDLEKISIITSLKNLLSFPFVKDAVENDGLGIHGLWHDIGKGKLYYYDAIENSFKSV